MLWKQTLVALAMGTATLVLGKPQCLALYYAYADEKRLSPSVPRVHPCDSINWVLPMNNNKSQMVFIHDAFNPDVKGVYVDGYFRGQPHNEKLRRTVAHLKYKYVSWMEERPQEELPEVDCSFHYFGELDLVFAWGTNEAKVAARNCTLRLADAEAAFQESENSYAIRKRIWKREWQRKASWLELFKTFVVSELGGDAVWWARRMARFASNLGRRSVAWLMEGYTDVDRLSPRYDTPDQRQQQSFGCTVHKSPWRDIDVVS